MTEKSYEYQVHVPESWVDHNGHMNDAEYNRAFSDAGVAWIDHLGLTETEIKSLSYTIFTLESHIVYLEEVFAGENIKIQVHLYDYDAKRVHIFMNLFNESGDRCAANEVMLMGMSTDSGRPAPFPEFLAEAVQIYYDTQDNEVELKELGRTIGIRR